MSKTDKREVIISAAQKRFLHFGVDKTTMNEIADDLAISKASLYYYFPDKLNLYAAVLKNIIDENETQKDQYLGENDPLKAITLYLENRTQFIIRYHNILEYLRTLTANVPKELEPFFTAARSREIKVMTLIFEKAKVAGVLKSDQPKYTAELFLDCLEGLRFSLIAHKANFFPDKKQFQALLKREKELTSIFIKGVSA